MNDSSEDQSGEYDFGYSGLKITWVEYAQIATTMEPLLVARGDELIDVQGIVSNDEWKPDWPVVLCFGDRSVYVNTKCDWWWAIGEWHDYRYSEPPETEGPEYRHASLVEVLRLKALLGKRLRDVYVLAEDRIVTMDGNQGIVLEFDSVTLVIEDAGDCLGLALLDGAQATDVLRKAVRIAP